MVDSPISVVNLLVIVDVGIVSSVSASVLGTMVVVSTDPYDELSFNDVKTVSIDVDSKLVVSTGVTL